MISKKMLISTSKCILLKSWIRSSKSYKIMVSKWCIYKWIGNHVSLLKRIKGHFGGIFPNDDR